MDGSDGTVQSGLALTVCLFLARNCHRATALQNAMMALAMYNHVVKRAAQFVTKNLEDDKKKKGKNAATGIDLEKANIFRQVGHRLTHALPWSRPAPSLERLPASPVSSIPSGHS